MLSLTSGTSSGTFLFRRNAFSSDGRPFRPHVEEANKLAPAWGRLFKETILVSDPARPFARAGKGTALRKVVLKTYDAEIKDLYVQRPHCHLIGLHH